MSWLNLLKKRFRDAKDAAEVARLFGDLAELERWQRRALPLLGSLASNSCSYTEMRQAQALISEATDK